MDPPYHAHISQVPRCAFSFQGALPTFEHVFKACAAADVPYVRLFANGLQWKIGTKANPGMGYKFLSFLTTPRVCISEGYTFPKSAHVDVARNVPHAPRNGGLMYPVFAYGQAADIPPDCPHPMDRSLQLLRSGETFRGLYGHSTHGTVRVYCNAELCEQYREALERCGADNGSGDAPVPFDETSVFRRLKDASPNNVEHRRDFRWLLGGIGKVKAYNGSDKHRLNGFCQGKMLSSKFIKKQVTYKRAANVLNAAMASVLSRCKETSWPQTSRIEVTFNRLMPSVKSYCQRVRFVHKHMKLTLRLERVRTARRRGALLAAFIPSHRSHASAPTQVQHCCLLCAETYSGDRCRRKLQPRQRAVRAVFIRPR
jgi:hypothetical protein